VLVVRLEPEHSPAVGNPGGALEALLDARGYATETLAISGETYNGAGIVSAEISQFTQEFGSDAEVVILVRSPHRYEWQRDVLASVIARHPGIVVVDMGAEGLDLSSARGWVRTFGASPVCSEAAVDALTADTAVVSQ
jgi:beta-N-acetylhexosaminidase